MRMPGLDDAKQCCKGGYYLDWLVAVVVIVITKAVIQDEVDYLGRTFTPEDPTLSYADTEKTVPAWVLYLVVTVGPVLFFVLFQIRQRCLIDLHHACLSILEAYTMACLLKNCLNKLGRYRPYTLSTGPEDMWDVDDEERASYPSGHAAYSFSSMTVVTWYLIGKFKIFHKPAQGHFALFFICNIPIAVATFIAASRAADYKHTFSDINAGSFIGMASGTAAYFLQYHGVFGNESGQPKSREEPQEAEAAAAPEPETSTVAITVAASDKEPSK